MEGWQGRLDRLLRGFILLSLLNLLPVFAITAALPLALIDGDRFQADMIPFLFIFLLIQVPCACTRWVFSGKIFGMYRP